LFKDAALVVVPSVNNIIGVWNGPAGSRLNTVGIWAPGIANNVELSFEYCITIDTTKQYLVALAGDNYVKFYVDGTLYVELNDATATGLTPFNYWHVFPVTLSAGTHIIKISGVNVGGPATVGGEIYDIGSVVTHGGETWYCIRYAPSGYGPFGGYIDVYWTL
jgi:hypothetical protein